MPLDELFAAVRHHHAALPAACRRRYHLINDESLAKMKRGVMLINTSRGALIDTQAVIRALKSGKIGSLGLDVYEEEADLFFEDLSNRVIQDDVFSRMLTFPNVHHHRPPGLLHAQRPGGHRPGDAGQHHRLRAGPDAAGLDHRRHGAEIAALSVLDQHHDAGPVDLHAVDHFAVMFRRHAPFSARSHRTAVRSGRSAERDGRSTRNAALRDRRPSVVDENSFHVAGTPTHPDQLRGDGLAKIAVMRNFSLFSPVRVTHFRHVVGLAEFHRSIGPVERKTVHRLGEVSQAAFRP